MKKNHCCEEDVFGYVWQNADADGIWDGNDASVAAEFGVAEDEAYSMLSELCDANHIQRIGTEKYIVTRWRERDKFSEEEERC
jgi:hypothetical protein